MPENAVQHVFGACIHLLEIQLCRNEGVFRAAGVRNLFWRRVHLVEWNNIHYRIEGCEVRLLGEAVKHGRGGGIKLVHRRQPQNLLNSPEEAGGVVWCADDFAAFGVGADAVSCRPVPAHMIPTVLRIIFNAENHRLRPETAVANGFGDLSEGKIIVRHTRCRTRRTGIGPAGMVVWQTNDD